mmetsp:Transcript_28554/g.76860  ORF Transcript_28554/g.76860 Transcript_28554/m.76860 type:complete len:296 (+) Transcript_28554:300-1187(+)
MCIYTTPEPQQVCARACLSGASSAADLAHAPAGVSGGNPSPSCLSWGRCCRRYQLAEALPRRRLKVFLGCVVHGPLLPTPQLPFMLPARRVAVKFVHCAEDKRYEHGHAHARDHRGGHSTRGQRFLKRVRNCCQQWIHNPWLFRQRGRQPISEERCANHSDRSLHDYARHDVATEHGSQQQELLFIESPVVVEIELLDQHICLLHRRRGDLSKRVELNIDEQHHAVHFRRVHRTAFVEIKLVEGFVDHILEHGPGRKARQLLLHLLGALFKQLEGFLRMIQHIFRLEYVTRHCVQ